MYRDKGGTDRTPWTAEVQAFNTDTDGNPIIGSVLPDEGNNDPPSLANIDIREAPKPRATRASIISLLFTLNLIKIVFKTGFFFCQYGDFYETKKMSKIINKKCKN